MPRFSTGPRVEYLEDRQLPSLASFDATLAAIPHLTPQDDADINRGPESFVDLALSPDGQHLATTTYGQNTIIIRDGKTGAPLTTLSGHTAQVWRCSYDPTGTKIISFAQDGTCRVWDAVSGKQLKQFSLPDWGARMEVSPDGKTVAFALASSQVLLLDLDTGSQTVTASAGDGVYFFPDGKKVASYLDRTINVYDKGTGASQSFSVQQHVVSFAVDPRGKFIVYGDQVGNVGVINVQSGACVVQPLPGAQINDVTFSPIGDVLYVTDREGKITLFDATTMGQSPMKQQPETLQAPQFASVIHPSPKNHLLIGAVGGDQTGKLFTLTVPQRLWGAVPAADVPVPASSEQDQVIGLALASLQNDIAALLVRAKVHTSDGMLNRYATGTPARTALMMMRTATGDLETTNTAFFKAVPKDHDVLASVQGSLTVKYETVLQQEQVLESLEADVDRYETVTLAGPVSGSASQRLLSQPLNHLGGSLSLSALRGTLTSDAVEQHVTGSAAARALGTINTSAAALPALEKSIGLAPNQVTSDMSRTVQIPGFGTVTVEADNGIRDFAYSSYAPYRFLAEQGGAVISTETGYDHGVFKTTKKGEGRISMFWTGARYVSAVSVTRLSNQGTARVYALDSSGNNRLIPVDGSGLVHIDANITRIDVYTDPGAAYGIERIDTRPITPAGTWSNIADVQRMEGSAATLDFATTQTLVTRVQGRIASDRAGDVITAHVYCGGKEISSVAIPSSGVFDLKQPAGLSGVVFTHSQKSGALFVGGLSLESNGTQIAAPFAVLSPETSRDVGIVSAPQWEQGDYNYIESGRKKGVLYRTGGQDVWVNGSLLEGVENPDPSQYQLLRVNMRGSGSVNINQLYYVNQNTMSGDLQPLPKEWYRQLTAQTVVIFPGAPRHLVVGMNGKAPIEMPTFTAQGPSEADVMPSDASKLSADFLQWQIASSGGQEGWTDVPAMVSTRPVAAVAGTTLGALFSIKNDGLQGTSVMVRVHVGPTGTASDPVQKTFTGVMSGMQKQALRAIVTIGQIGDSVSIEVVPASGQPFLYTSRTTQPQPKQLRVVDKDGNLVMKDIVTPVTREQQINTARLYDKIGRYTDNAELRQLALDLVMADTQEKQRALYARLMNLPLETVVETPKLVASLVKAETGPDSIEQVASENGRIQALIVAALQGHLPVDKADGTWFIQEGSPGHVGIESNAVDINLQGGLNVDKGKTVRAMLDGIVVDIDEAEGRVVMRHEIPDPVSKDTIVFFVEFVHLQSINPDILGRQIAAGDSVGQVGKVGGTMTAEMHMNVVYPMAGQQDFDPQYASLDLRSMLAKQGINSRAAVAGSGLNIGGPEKSLDLKIVMNAGKTYSLEDNQAAPLGYTNAVNQYKSQQDLLNKCAESSPTSAIIGVQAAIQLSSTLGISSLPYEVGKRLIDVIVTMPNSWQTDIFDPVNKTLNNMITFLQTRMDKERQAVNNDKLSAVERTAHFAEFALYSSMQSFVAGVKLMTPENTSQLLISVATAEVLSPIVVKTLAVVLTKGEASAIPFITKIAAALKTGGKDAAEVLIKDEMSTVPKAGKGAVESLAVEVDTIEDVRSTIAKKITNYSTNEVTIGNYQYSKHAILSMKDDGVYPSFVEDVLKNGVKSIDTTTDELRYRFEISNFSFYRKNGTSTVKNLRVVVDGYTGRIITVTVFKKQS